MQPLQPLQPFISFILSLFPLDWATPKPNTHFSLAENPKEGIVKLLGPGLSHLKGASLLSVRLTVDQLNRAWTDHVPGAHQPGYGVRGTSKKFKRERIP